MEDPSFVFAGSVCFPMGRDRWRVPFAVSILCLLWAENIRICGHIVKGKTNRQNVRF